MFTCRENVLNLYQQNHHTMGKLKAHYHDIIAQALHRDDTDYDYQEHLIAKAFELGKQAHRRGEYSIPSDDTEGMLPICRALDWESPLVQRAISNWIAGWERGAEEEAAAVEWIEQIEREYAAAEEIGYPAHF